MKPKLSDYDFDFPPELIAQHSAGKGKSRILQVSLKSDALKEIKAQNIVGLLKKGDCLVVNNTKVISARLKGKRSTGGVVEVLLLQALASGNTWQTMVKPGRAFKKGDEIDFQGVKAQVLEVNADGTRNLQFEIDENKFLPWLEKVGHTPLPPYIDRQEELADKEDYQAIFAKKSGAVAAPTASLHFNDEILNQLRAKGVQVAELTLHVGAGTFQNIKYEDYTQHSMHSEYYEISAENSEIINRAQKNGQRVLCVGTTVARVLETVADDSGIVHAGQGFTNKFIYPGYEWKFVRNLMTNFHWPRSSLILLVAALIGKSKLLGAYDYAVKNGFKLFSYGDGMLFFCDF